MLEALRELRVLEDASVDAEVSTRFHIARVGTHASTTTLAYA
jgi:hypothetical protein